MSGFHLHEQEAKHIMLPQSYCYICRCLNAVGVSDVYLNSDLVLLVACWASAAAAQVANFRAKLETPQAMFSLLPLARDAESISLGAWSVTAERVALFAGSILLRLI